MESIICKSCNSKVPEGVRFCPMCGREIGIRACMYCGAEVPRDAGFCQNCGRETINQPSGQPMAATPHVKKRRIGLAVFISVLFIIGVIIFAVFYLPNLNHQASLEENGALWAKANTALDTFVGNNLVKFAVTETSSITTKEIDQVTQQISDFDKTLKALETVKPPTDQIIVQKMLLPMYRGIYDQMVTIKDALVAGDPLKIDLEVQRLQLLLDELGGALEILTLETSPVQSQ